MTTFKDREQKVFSFMEQVQLVEESNKQEKRRKESTDYKFKVLESECEKGKGVCLDAVFSKIYKDAVPLNDDYKVAHGEDLDAEFRDFINDRCPKGMEYYVKEAIKKGSAPAKRIMEAVEKIVKDDYSNKARNIKNLDSNDLVFKMTDDTQEKINAITDDMGIDDLTAVIHDNVKNSVMSEINRAKQEKENIKNLEAELANDMNITSEAAAEKAIAKRGFNRTKVFQPSLFQGIMIGMTEKANSIYESSDDNVDYQYEALSEFDYKSDGASSIEEAAFIESVKEFTKLNIVKAFKLEQFTPRRVNDLASKYARK